ncbi:integrase [Sphingobium yanoikuyae]|jgi:integrase|uniref:Integrase n=2 Tax=Sphingobium yanoikuyae TaxID=13690 RepID=A0A6P1GF07_SPHYA|nr:MULTISPECIES: integrase [Sphingobium]PHP18978.1 integrase [Sphingobium sp. IP1]QHD67009.1 integrase [Sphingobium yanoikuyae]
MILLLAQAAAFAPDIAISSRSRFSDDMWHLDDIRPGCSRGDYSLDWGFTVATGRFTDPALLPWLAAAKTLLWSAKVDPPPGRRHVHDGTLMRLFKGLRLLIRWMADQGYRRFADLDRGASERFMAAMAERRNPKGELLKTGTLHHYRSLLILIYLQGARYPTVAIGDPFPGTTGMFKRSDRGWLPYTPDAIAVPLLSSALRLIGPAADDILALQGEAQAAYDAALASGLSPTKAGFRVIDAIAPFRFQVLSGEEAPWHRAPVTSTKTVRYLADRLYDACFVTIAWLVGARLSEILGLEAGCIERHPSATGDERFAYLTGRIFKTSRGYHGDAHRWIAPEPVVRAVAVMEKLTDGLRRRSRRKELFLITSSTGLIGPAVEIDLPATYTIIRRLNLLFAPFIGLPLHEGKPWHLNTHQGRKTFARFVGKRDRTGLAALQAHLGHVTRAMTDSGYVGTDFQLDELIDRHAQEETRAALEEMLTATALGGKAGRVIAARSRFRGCTRNGDVQAYVDFLMAETDLRLGVCDWGYCVYRPETSACFGGEAGPNPVLRTETTCSTCANFAVTPRHRSVWEMRRARNLKLLEQPVLDAGSRALAEARVAECDRILTQLDEG